MSDCIRKWLAAGAFVGAIGFVAVTPTILFTVDALAERPAPVVTNTSSGAIVAPPQAGDTNYLWLISIATPIAVIASAWGAVKSVQSSHAETMLALKAANDATNEKVDVLAEKLEKIGREVAYFQGKLDRPTDD